MRCTVNLLTLSLIICFASKLQGQDALREAHAQIQSYFNEALSGPRTAAKDQILAQKASSLKASVFRLVPEGIVGYLNTHGGISPNELAAILTETLSISQSPDEAGIASVVSLAQNGPYVVAFDANTCISCSSGWIGVFVSEQGHYVLREKNTNEVVNQSVKLSLLGENTVVLSGTNWGDAHNQLQVRLYDLATGLHETWSALDLPNGQITVQNGNLTVRYRSAKSSNYLIIEKKYSLNDGALKLSATRFYKEP